MKSLCKLILTSVGFLFIPLFSFGQLIQPIDYLLEKAPNNLLQTYGEPRINAFEYELFLMDVERLKSELTELVRTSDTQDSIRTLIKLPHPDGQSYWYSVKTNTTMSNGLIEKFPEIRTFDAYGVDIPSKAKIDITHKGFHAMIMQPGINTIFIDPAFEQESSYYMVYFRKNIAANERVECLTTSDSQDEIIENDVITPKNYVSCELRTYRLALAATVEYSNFHGGTVADALAAQITTMNRVNGLYERDLAVTMTIIPDNDLLIYTGDPNSDPFTNGNAILMLDENQINTDQVIGTANYDIGHVFGTNSGGVASLGSICLSEQKARGVTGSNAPINDPFDVDYVAHEIGHQFGANHTQNNPCNRNNATAMEPGSASTILGYAGICQPNIQGFSDDYFHGVSLQEMGNRIVLTSCDVKTALSNNTPVIDSTNANIIIPAATPFALKAYASDLDNDILTYCWEQMDNQISPQPPVEDASGGPNFRSFSPSNEAVRYFPSLNNLISNNSFVTRWEILPTVNRTMNFRVTVRDQAIGVAGCLDYKDVTISTTTDAGPFILMYPSEQGIMWTGFEDEIVTWDIANTNKEPVNCKKVDIFLSTDGGLSYPITLASNVPNSGAANVLVPNIQTTTARVMVMSSEGTFFNISENNFQIQEISNDFVLRVDPPIQQFCTPEQIDFNVYVDSLDGFNEPVELAVSEVSNGISISLNKQNIIPADSAILSVTMSETVNSENYFITVEATSSTGTKTRKLEFIVNNSVPSPVVQLSPAKGLGNDALQWEESNEINARYDIQIASDSKFNSIIEEAYGVVETSYTAQALSPTSNYYWRLRVVTECGVSDWTAPYFDENKVTLYPNPTTDFLTISWVGAVKKIELSDALGRIVERKHINQTTSSVLDLTPFSAGVYHISIFSDKGRFIYDIIKQ